MICDDFKILAARGPMDITRAERKAMCNHFRSCTPCEIWLYEQIKDTDLPSTEEVKAVIDLHRKDQFDPEIR